MSERHIDDLNQRHGIAGQLHFAPGPGGRPLARIDTPFGHAELSPYGAQLLSWLPQGQPRDVLFLSGLARYEAGKAIRGGVPLCWPWFGPDPEQLGRPAHGLARTRTWDIQGSGTEPDGSVRLSLVLRDDADSRALWPHPFELGLTLQVGQALTLALVTRNLAEVPVTIGQALHSYFAVGDIDQASVHGLHGCAYQDKVDGGSAVQDGVLRISCEVDRVYQDPPAELTLDDPALGRRIRITSAGSRSAVVWNPGPAIAAAMADLGDADYRHMLCVETANAGADTVTLAPGASHRLATTFQLVPR